MIWHILTGAALHFSEQLKVPLKYEPQDLHWSNLQVIVHSGILEDSGMKEYHAYLTMSFKIMCLLAKFLMKC